MALPKEKPLPTPTPPKKVNEQQEDIVKAQTVNKDKQNDAPKPPPMKDNVKVSKTTPVEKQVVTPKQEVNHVPQNKQAGAYMEAIVKKNTNRPPTYPRVARMRGYQGTVLVRAFISKAGRVEDVEILNSSGYKLLDQAAYKAVKKWKFQPAQRFGINVHSTLDIPLVFELNNV